MIIKSQRRWLKREQMSSMKEDLSLTAKTLISSIKAIATITRMITITFSLKLRSPLITQKLQTLLKI